MGRKTLRPYQTRAITDLYNDWHAGYLRLAIAAATGAGKSVIFGEVARRHIAEIGGKILLVVHRGELVHQAAGHFRNANPDLKVEVLRGSPGPKKSTQRASKINRLKRADVICTTPQTLASAATMAVFPNPSLIIVDEGHRAMAPQYMKVLKALGAFSGTRTLVVTATPFREDYRDFSDLVQKISASIDIWWLITHNDRDGVEYECEPGDGYLVEPELHHLLVDGLDLRQVPLSRIGGSVDFREGALAEAMEEAGAFKALVDAILAPKFSHVRKGVIFAPSVESSKYIAEALTAHGVECGHVDGTTPDKERERILREWGEGKFGWVCNVNVLTEGYDLPDIEMVTLARPTKSRIFFRQSIGRGLRPAPGKRKCIVLDVAGASDGMSLAGIESLTDVETVVPGRSESLKDLLDRTAREKQGRLDRCRALAERAAELESRVKRNQQQIVMTCDSLRKDLPGVDEFASALKVPAGNVFGCTEQVAQRMESLSEMNTLDELATAEKFFDEQLRTARPFVTEIEEIKAKLRNSLATAQEEPESEVARALVTGNVQTVRGNLFGLGEERDKPGRPGEDVQELSTRTRDKRPKPVIEQRHGWAIRTSDGHLFAPVHKGGEREPIAHTVAVRLGEDRYLPVYWLASGDADDFAPVTTEDDAYRLIIEKATKETEAINLLNPMAAWRKTAATVGGGAWNFATKLHPKLDIPDNATAGYISDLIALGKNEKRVNKFAKWVLSVR